LCTIVTRVRPGTSKGITDLLLPHFSDLIGRDLSKKELALLGGSWHRAPKQAPHAPEVAPRHAQNPRRARTGLRAP